MSGQILSQECIREANALLRSCKSLPMNSSDALLDLESIALHVRDIKAAINRIQHGRGQHGN